MKTSVERAFSIARIDLRQQLEADVTAPRKALDRRRPRRVDRDRLAVEALDDAARARARGPDEARQRLVEIGERRRQPPHAKLRARCARSRASASSTCTPRFDRHQLVPLVDDDGGEVREALAPVGARQQQRQALGRGDERGGQSAFLARARRRRRVAGAHVDGPARLQRRGGAREREPGVLRERAQRRDPEHAQAAAARPRVPAGPRTSGPSHAAYVLPMPVGAWIRPDSPRA